MFIVKSEMHSSMETALMWYATAPETDVAACGGSLARIAISLHGSPAELDEMRAKLKLRDTSKNLPLLGPVTPPLAPRRVAVGDANAALGAVAEEPAVTQLP